jgi:hypothetical protein
MQATAKALQVVNQLRADGVISKFAVGGAVGAIFYVEPTQTQDIDIFILLDPEHRSGLVEISPIVRRLKELGYSFWQDDKLVVEKWPIQFIPASKPVEIEAIENAMEVTVTEGVTTFVPPAEYLMAIAIDLGRPKDVLRLYQFQAEKVYDPDRLEAVLDRHGLRAKWERILSLFKDQKET